MLIYILSRNPDLYSTKRLFEAAKNRGHDVLVRDPLAFTVQVQDAKNLVYQSRPIAVPDAVIPRIGASITQYGLAVVRQFEQMNVFTLNSSNAIAASRDKLHSLQLLSRDSIPLPRTVFVRRRRDTLKAIETVGGAPVVIKLLAGTQGMGVVLAPELNTAQALIELLQAAKQNILVQKFVEEARGQDIRAFVIGNRVIAAMKRKSSNPIEFRANVHRGAQVEKIKLGAEFNKMAIRAAEILGLSVAGVDLLEGKDGPLIVEVNSSPGLEAIEKASGIDIAETMVQHIESKVKA